MNFLIKLFHSLMGCLIKGNLMLSQSFKILLETDKSQTVLRMEREYKKMMNMICYKITDLVIINSLDSFNYLF